MMDYLVSLGVWNWFILGGLLLVVEIIAPGTFMLWLGLSALIVGVVSLVVAWPWQAQLVAFAVLSIVSIIVWRRMSPKLHEVRAQPFLNRRTEGYIGRVFTLERPIVDGAGTVRIDDTIWQVRGTDCPSGTRVKVTDADGATLHVMPTDDLK